MEAGKRLSLIDKKLDKAFGLIRKNESAIGELEKRNVAFEKDHQHLLSLIVQLKDTISKLDGTIITLHDSLEEKYVTKESLKTSENYREKEGKYQRVVFTLIGSIGTFVLLGVLGIALGFTS